MQVKDQVNFEFPQVFNCFSDNETPISFVFNLPGGYRVIGNLSEKKRLFLETSLPLVQDHPDSEIKQKELFLLVMNAKDDEDLLLQKDA